MSLKPCCATGALHSGTTTGRTEKVHGLECYVADAPSGNPEGIIVIIPDAFGIALANNKILADEYAKKTNAQVFLPDFMDGFVLNPDVMVSMKALSATGWWNQLYKVGHVLYLLQWFPVALFNLRDAKTRPRIFPFFQALKENEAKNLPIGTAGFCWGAKYVTELCWDQTKTKDGKRVVECGFVAHPSGLKYPGDIEMIVLPYSCAAAEHDMQMSAEQAKQTKDVLTAKTAKTKDHGVKHEFVMYDGAHHGFAVRADEDEKVEAEQGKKAEAQAIDWFKGWFANPSPSV
ncbi:hypothetical protein LTR91_012667 [Friedmanniomyces endolithicus]|uniref:Dienelactone hydrolase domain-containing protein n=1 Tax=Friedmanniomyces endolithicus TaxID=329885 RepID=A0AAN6KF76_9PEZI|nr:hypothetical protein LTR57_012392 [Friedmanniomyces endolithicus]KAK0979308.1 hypothetical protein LTR91_012667 [Friedmanniomyces endolithicus]KAK0983850.1 hypothetical protein LTS01_010906 [Friedmanniomyces endolithicus]KAK1042411.1 hypothetical protein LTS16_008814 [Friedmanniomyces endolithicus]KAK1066784.1 hypothetical protein LTR33_011509 [Friedmanniomyces endolithicus]